MSKQFDESKHPRDDSGRFMNGGVKEYRQNSSYEELTNSHKNGKIELSHQEWAQLYAKLGEIKRGGYVHKTSNGEQLISLGSKIVVVSGTYETPKLKTVMNFSSENEMFVWLEEFGGIK